MAKIHISSAKNTENATIIKTAKIAKNRKGAFDFGFKRFASTKNQYL